MNFFLFFQYSQFRRKSGIQLMAAHDRDDMCVERAHKGNIAKDIQNLMADKFVGEFQF